MGLFTKLLDYFNLDNMKERSNQRNSANSDKIIIDMNEKLVPTPSSKGLTPSPNPVTDKEPTKDNISISNTDANKILSTNIILKKDEADADSLGDYEIPESAEQPYISNRFSIKGLDIFFIDIAREIVNSGTIETVPLMRKYSIDYSRLQNIITEIQNAKIIDENHKILISPSEFEKFIDIYEPSLFDSINGSFDKDIFMCIGEIFYEKGIEAVYSCLDADDVVNYLNIFEKLQILKFNDDRFEILMDKASFLEVCNNIPNSFSPTNDTKEDYNIMTGVEFEQFCSSLLIKNGFKNVKTTPPTSDHGIDIFAEKNEITYAIQCKCYSSNVGNSSVQQAYSGKCFYKKDIGVVLTNQFFTEQAKKEATELGIKLWDKNKLDTLIKNANV